MDLFIWGQCQISSIIQPTSLTDMTTPLNTMSTQEIDLYTHFYEADWPTDNCGIGYRIKGGDTPYASLTGTTLTLAPSSLGDVGVHSMMIEAYFETYKGSVAPVQTHEQTI